MTGSPAPGGRAQPFYCPYCGEEDFVPFGDGTAGYLCRSCTRHYEVRFVGLVPHTAEEG